MKSNSSPNDIPSKFLKIASCIVSEWLSNFFNKCITIGEFPDSQKIAHITPIPKVHSPSSSSEYRSISVLSKLFEKVLYHRVYSYLTEHNLIDKRQYGFRENQQNQPLQLFMMNCSETSIINYQYVPYFWTYQKHLTAVTMIQYLTNFITMVSEVFLINYSQLFCVIECSALKQEHLNLHTKGYLAESLRVVLFCLCFSLSTLTISQKFPLLILLYLLMILIFICQTPVLMFFRQLLTLNYEKLTTG